MQRCLILAEKGAPYNHPNPLVGCVLVLDGSIIGEGYHQKYGEDHAEVNAIRAVEDEENLRASTLYVNLEPCAHHGHTPPCADLIIAKGIPRVVCAMEDPNVLVAGKGIKKLRDAGIEVMCGVLETAALTLNKAFVTFHSKNRPHIVLKWAKTADNFMARLPADRHLDRQISGDVANLFVHRLRAESSAILVGSKTILADDPQLTTRLWQGPNPMRLVFDPENEIPITARILNDGLPTTIIGKASGDDLIDEMLSICRNNRYIQVLIEGGAGTITHFLESGLWDEAFVIESQTKWEEGVPSPGISAHPAREIALGADVMKYYVNPKA